MKPGGLGRLENNDLMESNTTVEKSLPRESKLTELAEQEQDVTERPKRMSVLQRTVSI